MNDKKLTPTQAVTILADEGITSDPCGTKLVPFYDGPAKIDITDRR